MEARTRRYSSTRFRQGGSTCGTVTVGGSGDNGDNGGDPTPEDGLPVGAIALVGAALVAAYVVAT